MATNQTVPLKPPVKNPHNVEATKYYIFNETGNIMMASTIDSSQPLSQEVQDVFSEVSVFFAGMSRAITNTINPETNQPFSLYNYTALGRIISGSGLFVHVTEEDVLYQTNQFGANFSKELIESLLGLATGAGALSFASAMISSIGNEGLNINGSSSTSDSKVGNIVFVCEYLLGMPIISAIVVYCDAKEHKQQLQLGPCFKESSVTTSWTMHKDTYMFVTPKFINNYAGNLDSITSDPQYLEMIEWFSGLLLQTPEINQVVNSSYHDQPVESGSELDPANTYTLLGQFFGSKKGSLQFTNNADNKASITTGSWNTDAISFTVKGTLTTASAIEVLDASKKVIATTAESFTITASS